MYICTQTKTQNGIRGWQVGAMMAVGKGAVAFGKDRRR
jgi:hypothetical protein